MSNFKNTLVSYLISHSRKELRFIHFFTACCSLFSLFIFFSRSAHVLQIQPLFKIPLLTSFTEYIFHSDISPVLLSPGNGALYLGSYIFIYSLRLHWFFALLFTPYLFLFWIYGAYVSIYYNPMFDLMFLSTVGLIELQSHSWFECFTPKRNSSIPNKIFTSVAILLHGAFVWFCCLVLEYSGYDLKLWKDISDLTWAEIQRLSKKNT